MKVVSFNVNGLRARLHQLDAVVARHAPDFIGLQETKVSDDMFPIAEIKALGYDAIYHGQKGHYGVALLYRSAPRSSACGLRHDGEDSQRRLVYGSFEFAGKPLHIYNGYFPQGENREHPTKFPNKKQFYADLYAQITTNHQPGDAVVVMGDMNVAPQDIDIGIGDDNRKRWLRDGKCCFLPEERIWLEKLTNWGLADTFRELNGTAPGAYSWFDYRSRGFERSPPRGLRIDLILASTPLTRACTDTGIDIAVRAMEKPSDHCPVWATFDL